LVGAVRQVGWPAFRSPGAARAAALPAGAAAPGVDPARPGAAVPRVDPALPGPAAPRVDPARPGAGQALIPADPVGYSAPWDRTGYLPDGSLPRPADAAAALAAGKRVFGISAERGKAEAVALGEFFARYPSRGANQLAFFHALWAQQHKFEDNPLRAFLYHVTGPIDAQGRPKNAAWQAYADAVSAGLPGAEVERRFLAAHIQEFRDVVRRPEFKRLYALASDDYRQVVEAYLDALQQFEADLAAGRDPEQVARRMTWDTGVWLRRRKARNQGLEVSWLGVRNLLSPGQAGTRQFWRALWAIGTGMVLDAKPARPAPTAAMLDLTAVEARRLARETGLPFQAGRVVMTAEMLSGGTVAEPDRRPPARRGGEPRRYPLLPTDFTGPQKLRPATMAGADGVMSAEEVHGALRNVQARVRSQLVAEFFGKYPVPEAGILVYSANMLAMNGTYGQSRMFGTLANAIMPVDNDGKPKNALWQAYADAYDRYKASAEPSMEVLERLWFRAHMEDFKIVDTPAFQRQLAVFWAQAAGDRAMAPMVTYTRAMVGGRQLFEQVAAEHLSDEVAFKRSFAHFAKTVALSGSFPFWKEDLAEAVSWFRRRKDPPLDSRGLPTDATMFARAAAGIRMMAGLRRVLSEGIAQDADRAGARVPAAGMLDLAEVLPPDQLRRVDPRVVRFYRDPRGWDVRVGVDFKNWFSKQVLGRLDPFLADMGKVPDRVRGFEGYALEQDLYRDRAGGTHWDRFVVVDGRRKTLFPARFEAEKGRVVETFSVHGHPVRLVFDVSPHQGGIRLVLNRKLSSFVLDSDIVFETVPTPTGLRTRGTYNCSFGLVNGAVDFRMTEKVPALAPSATGLFNSA